MNKYNFRAWDKTYRCFRYFILTSYGIAKSFNENEPVGDLADIQLSSGKKDLAGREIYEGDIVNYRGIQMTVEFSKDIACFECTTDITSRALYGYIKDGGVEVVGNICKNHEIRRD